MYIHLLKWIWSFLLIYTYIHLLKWIRKSRPPMFISSIFHLKKRIWWSRLSMSISKICFISWKESTTIFVRSFETSLSKHVDKIRFGWVKSWTTSWSGLIKSWSVVDLVNSGQTGWTCGSGLVNSGQIGWTCGSGLVNSGQTGWTCGSGLVSSWLDRWIWSNPGQTSGSGLVKSCLDWWIWMVNSWSDWWAK